MDDQMQNRYPYTLAFPTGKKELIFSVAAILCGWFLWNTLHCSNPMNRLSQKFLWQGNPIP